MSNILQMPREWQRECLTILRETIWPRKRHALVVATPGAGKTTLAMLFARDLITSKEINHVHVVAPTRPLRQHWQDAAKDFGIILGRRSNARLRMAELPLDVGGVVTTYAQVAGEPDAHLAAIEGRRALIVLDEVHHAGDRRAWGDGVTEAFADARLILSLSGTPFRNDDTTIAQVQYGPDGISKADYSYGYARAISENVCRPVVFRPYNALVEYERRGQEFSQTFSDDLPDRQMSDLLRHALHPRAGLINQMIRDADNELSGMRSRGARWQDAAGLVVCMSQGHAYECAKIIKEVTGEEPIVVVSDNESAEDDLNAFKNGISRWIVAVRMVSEGVDIPRLMVSVYATNVISTLFFRQFVGRTVRVRHQAQEETSYIFIPGDPRLAKEASNIEAEVKRFLRDVGADNFKHVRGEVERAERKLIEVEPRASQIEGGGVIYRGEEFTADELAAAESKRHFFPNGDRIEPAQVAWTIRQLGRAA